MTTKYYECHAVDPWDIPWDDADPIIDPDDCYEAWANMDTPEEQRRAHNG